jgi:hypothetical protein
MNANLRSSDFENFPTMNHILREQIVGRVVVDLLVSRDCTVLALDNGAMLEVPGFVFDLGSRVRSNL